MTQVTVKQLADEVKTPIERLLQQMREAGLPHTAAEEHVTDSEKQSLLTHLKSSHKAKVEEPRKITLQRKTTSTLRVAGSKSISVEVRKKKAFAQRSPEEIEAERKRELEERRAVESAARQKAEDEAKRRVEEDARRLSAAAPANTTVVDAVAQAPVVVAEPASEAAVAAPAPAVERKREEPRRPDKPSTDDSNRRSGGGDSERKNAPHRASVKEKAPAPRVAPRTTDEESDPFDPKMFSTLLLRVVTKLTEYLSDDRIHGLSLDPPLILLEKAKSIKEKDGSEHTTEQQLLDILDLHISSGIHVSSAGYMARQYSSVPPVTAIYDLVSAILPQPATFYEGGPLPNVADKIIKHEFGRFLGWHADDFDMISTSGASLGNLTAVLAARNTQLGSTWSAGVQQAERMVPAIAVGGDSHYSVERLAGIIGIGQDNVIRLPLNQRRQICVDAARDCLERATNEGKRVFCLIAAAGTTSVGANDPIFALSKLAAQYEAWLHVDAAHNGAFLVSDKLRKRVSDLRYADSFCLDAHKTLFVPAACTLLFYRDKRKAKSAFPTFASYVQDTNEDVISDFESGMKNFECTKRPSILNLWVAWKLYGREFFEEKLNYLVHTTFEAYRLIQEFDDFTPINVPESNILCFRFLPEGISQTDIGPLQLRIKERINNEGRYYISKVDIDGTPALRLVIMNHKVSVGNVRSLLHEIRRIGSAEMPAPLS